MADEEQEESGRQLQPVDGGAGCGDGKQGGKQRREMGQIRHKHVFS